ncbi:hypothetical protein NDU88_006912 [Pleurodeles waltl]|uniref:Uncharacterized protein n=1 Tax=Pleurodeles waltl TaxID=8319 RepID=A0AAV7SR09_PLEWA|nr:hypothetical protein NDU88_006912 [Pleurodeles waltl]
MACAPGEACLIPWARLEDGWAEAVETVAAVLEQCLHGGSCLLLVFPGGRLHIRDQSGALLEGGALFPDLQPEEVWRWLEMWDKAALGRPAGTNGVARRASGADDPYWQTREGGQTEVSMDRVSEDDPAPRIEIQQDGTMAVVPAGLVDGSGAGPDLDSLSASTQN